MGVSVFTSQYYLMTESVKHCLPDELKIIWDPLMFPICKIFDKLLTAVKAFN